MTPQDIARILTKLRFRRRPDADDDGMESWVDQKGRGNVEVSVSESGRWVIMWEDIRVMGYGLGQLGKKLIGILAQKQKTNEGGLDELTGTGGIAGFGTPYAFSGNDEDKKKVNEAFESLVVEARGVTPQQYRRFLKNHGLRMTRANVDASTSTSHIVGDLWVQEPTNVEVIVSHLGNWKVSWHRDSKYGNGLSNLKSALSKYFSIRDGVNEGTRHTANNVEKMLKQAGYRNLGDKGTYDEWEKPYKTGSTTIFVNLAGWNVNGGPSGHHPTQLKTYLTKRVNEGGDPYYGWRNDETQTPRQKIGGAITEINKQLREVERVVKRTQRLKKETGTSNSALWNRTNKSLMKIESRMHRISQTIRNMRG